MRGEIRKMCDEYDARQRNVLQSAIEQADRGNIDRLATFKNENREYVDKYNADIQAALQTINAKMASDERNEDMAEMLEKQRAKTEEAVMENLHKMLVMEIGDRFKDSVGLAERVAALEIGSTVDKVSAEKPTLPGMSLLSRGAGDSSETTVQTSSRTESTRLNISSVGMSSARSSALSARNSPTPLGSPVGTGSTPRSPLLSSGLKSGSQSETLRRA